MKKITAAALLSIILITAALLILAPNKAAEKTVVDENVINKTALSASASVPTHSPTANSSQTQQPTSMQAPQQPYSTQYEKALPLPSPFIVAVFIIGLVAVFGLILSLCLRKRSKRETSARSPAARMVTAHRKLDD
jgi:multisubunit Na+/H+ antiporter MnhC subunit